MTRDLLLIAGSAVLWVVALFLTLTGSLREGVPALIFASSCLIVFVARIRAAARTRAALATSGSVCGVGGAKLRASRTRAMLASGMFVAIGVSFSWEFAPQGVWPAAIGWVSVAFGLTGWAMGLARGKDGGAWIMLSPTGLAMGNRKGSYTVPWDDIAGARIGEFYRQPYVFLEVPNLARTLASVDPPSVRDATARSFSTSAGMTGFPIAVQPSLFGVEPVWFVRAVKRYATEPEARAELTPPLAELSST